MRTLVADLLRHGLGVRFLDHEVRVPEVRGRIDALFGATLFEFKTDLRREDADVQARVPDYLREREQHTRQRWVAIVTDGATFVTYEYDDEAVSCARTLRLDANRSAVIDFLALKRH